MVFRVVPAESFEARKKVRAPHGRTHRVRPGDDGIRLEVQTLIFREGQITRCCVQIHLQKYFASRLTQITCLFFAIPSREGDVGHRH